MSEDPIGFKAGVNFYAYVGNNPINYNDPMGLVRWGDVGFALFDLAVSGSGIVLSSAAVGLGYAGIVAPEPGTTLAGAGLCSGQVKVATAL